MYTTDQLFNNGREPSFNPSSLADEILNAQDHIHLMPKGYELTLPQAPIIEKRLLKHQRIVNGVKYTRTMYTYLP